MKGLVSILVCLLLMTSTALAHSGDTDSSGGHYDFENESGLGSYHYHHGEEAHLHPNGVCPYTVATSEPEQEQDSLEGFEYDEEFDCWWGEYGGIDCNGDFHTYESMEYCIYCEGNITMWGHYDPCTGEPPFPPYGYEYYDGIWVGDDGYYTDDGEFHEYIDPSEYDAEFCSECEQFIESPDDHQNGCSMRAEYEEEDNTSDSEDDGSSAGFLLLCCLGLGLIIYIPYRIHVFISE